MSREAVPLAARSNRSKRDGVLVPSRSLPAEIAGRRCSAFRARALMTAAAAMLEAVTAIVAVAVIVVSALLRLAAAHR